jgi:hypothetical protein
VPIFLTTVIFVPSTGTTIDCTGARSYRAKGVGESAVCGSGSSWIREKESDQRVDFRARCSRDLAKRQEGGDDRERTCRLLSGEEGDSYKTVDEARQVNQTTIPR